MENIACCFDGEADYELCINHGTGELFRVYADHTEPGTDIDYELLHILEEET